MQCLMLYFFRHLLACVWMRGATYLYVSWLSHGTLHVSHVGVPTL